MRHVVVDRGGRGDIGGAVGRHPGAAGCGSRGRGADVDLDELADGRRRGRMVGRRQQAVGPADVLLAAVALGPGGLQHGAGRAGRQLGLDVEVGRTVEVAVQLGRAGAAAQAAEEAHPRGLWRWTRGVYALVGGAVCFQGGVGFVFGFDE